MTIFFVADIIYFLNVVLIELFIENNNYFKYTMIIVHIFQKS